MELAGISTPAAAFVAGLVTSLHCAGMCGPLACMMAPAKADKVDPFTVATVYHGARLTGYTLLGVVAGGLGRLPFDWSGSSAVRVLPWVLVAFFVVVGLRLEKRLPRFAVLGCVWSRFRSIAFGSSSETRKGAGPALTSAARPSGPPPPRSPWPSALSRSRWTEILTRHTLTRLQWKLQGALRGRSRLRVAAVMGAATPLLPCGPLYFLIAMAAFTGSAVRGAEFMLAFGLGTVPLLWLVQANYGRLKLRLTPVTLTRLQAGLALVTALVLTWRLRVGGSTMENFICH